MLKKSSMLLFCSLGAAENLPPLACLHEHVDSRPEVDDLVRLAQLKDKPLPPGASPKQFSYNSDNWAEFEAGYKSGYVLFDNVNDLKWQASTVGNRMKEQNVVYGEQLVSPDTMTEQNIDWRGGLLAYQQGMTEAQKDGKITLTALVTFRRGAPDGAQAAMDYVNYVIENKLILPDFKGFHLSGDEHVDNLETFLPAFQLAKANGFGCAVHAGEFGPANTQDDQTLGINNMLQALKCITPDGKPLFDRIGHGLAASLSSAQQVRELLKAQNVPLEMCVSSNHCLEHIATLADHPLPSLMQEGLVCCYGNTDDGRLFNTDNMQETLKIKNTFGFTNDDIYNNTCNTIKYAFLAEAKKKELLAKVAAWKIQNDKKKEETISWYEWFFSKK